MNLMIQVLLNITIPSGPLIAPLMIILVVLYGFRNDEILSVNKFKTILAKLMSF